jgi:hypothetical protein
LRQPLDISRIAALTLIAFAGLAIPERMNDATRAALRDLETHGTEAGTWSFG